MGWLGGEVRRGEEGLTGWRVGVRPAASLSSRAARGVRLVRRSVAVGAKVVVGGVLSSRVVRRAWEGRGVRGRRGGRAVGMMVARPVRSHSSPLGLLPSAADVEARREIGGRRGRWDGRCWGRRRAVGWWCGGWGASCGAFPPGRRRAWASVRPRGCGGRAFGGGGRHLARGVAWARERVRLGVGWGRERGPLGRAGRGLDPPVARRSSCGPDETCLALTARGQPPR